MRFCQWSQLNSFHTTLLLRTIVATLVSWVSLYLRVCVSFPSAHFVPSDKINSIRKCYALKECFFCVCSFPLFSIVIVFFFFILIRKTPTNILHTAALLSFCRDAINKRATEKTFFFPSFGSLFFLSLLGEKLETHFEWYEKKETPFDVRLMERTTTAGLNRL